jgi:putative transposase
MRDTMEVELVLSALRMAREARQPAPGLIFHSDRGGQYASAAYGAELTAHGMLASMSGKGNCYDCEYAFDSPSSHLTRITTDSVSWH